MTLSRWGVLLVNLGTPDSTRTPDVRRYLREFLSDPRVLDINPVVRSLLLNLVILPTRPRESGEAYEKIWTKRGSPLLFHSLDLVDKVRGLLPGVPVELAMRYQNPSIASALDRLRDAGVDRILALPLFPQYSSAANGSAIEKVFTEAARRWNVPTIHIIDEFYDHPAFIRAFAEVARPHLEAFQPDFVLLSYHGVPERHVTKSDESGGSHCLASAGCCDRIVPANRRCYRAQCYATSRALAAELGWSPDDYHVAFQSRLGRDPWIRPYTDEEVVRFAREGRRRLAVFCPAFVADCLETIEEIGMRAKEDFVEAGGEDLLLVPSLNAEDVWAAAVAGLVRENLPPAWGDLDATAS